MKNLYEEQTAKVSVVLLRKTACIASVGHLSDTKERKPQENSRFSRFSDAEFRSLGKQKNSRVSWGINKIGVCFIVKFYVVNARVILSVIILSLLAAGFVISGRYIAVSSTPKEVPVYSVDTDKNEISITFDCAWSADDIDSIIETLEKYNCPAVFFAVGDWAEKYPDAVKKLSENGHTVANHSYSHAHFNSLSKEEMIADMDKCDSLIESITQKRPVLFRAPYGEYNDTLINACRETNRHYIQWSVDSLDWKDISADEIYDRIIKKTKAGDILLFHNGTKHTKDVLPKILETLSQQYTFVLTEDLIYKDNYTIDNAGKQHKNS